MSGSSSDCAAPGWTLVESSTNTKWSIAPGQALRVGRLPGSDVVVASMRTSREHAVLACGEDGVLRLRELSASNGTEVNGLRVRSSCRLSAGNRIVFTCGRVVGDHEPSFVVKRADAAAVPNALETHNDESVQATEPAPPVNDGEEEEEKAENVKAEKDKETPTNPAQSMKRRVEEELVRMRKRIRRELEEQVRREYDETMAKSLGTLQCAICFLYQQNLAQPVAEGCVHTFCATCLASVKQQRCPLCRRPYERVTTFRVPNDMFMEAQALNERLEAAEQQEQEPASICEAAESPHEIVDLCSVDESDGDAERTTQEDAVPARLRPYPAAVLRAAHFLLQEVMRLHEKGLLGCERSSCTCLCHSLGNLCCRSCEAGSTNEYIFKAEILAAERALDESMSAALLRCPPASSATAVSAYLEALGTALLQGSGTAAATAAAAAAVSASNLALVSASRALAERWVRVLLRLERSQRQPSPVLSALAALPDLSALFAPVERLLHDEAAADAEPEALIVVMARLELLLERNRASEALSYAMEHAAALSSQQQLMVARRLATIAADAAERWCTHVLNELPPLPTRRLISVCSCLIQVSTNGSHTATLLAAPMVANTTLADALFVQMGESPLGVEVALALLRRLFMLSTDGGDEEEENRQRVHRLCARVVRTAAAEQLDVFVQLVSERAPSSALLALSECVYDTAPERAETVEAAGAIARCASLRRCLLCSEAQLAFVRSLCDKLGDQALLDAFLLRVFSADSPLTSVALLQALSPTARGEAVATLKQRSARLQTSTSIRVLLQAGEIDYVSGVLSDADCLLRNDVRILHELLTACPQGVPRTTLVDALVGVFQRFVDTTREDDDDNALRRDVELLPDAGELLEQVCERLLSLYARKHNVHTQLGAWLQTACRLYQDADCYYKKTRLLNNVKKRCQGLKLLDSLKKKGLFN